MGGKRWNKRKQKTGAKISRSTGAPGGSGKTFQALPFFPQPSTARCNLELDPNAKELKQ
jgi:hypothetical protein